LSTNLNDKSNTITVDNVSFSYPESREKAINGVSFSAGPGEHIALVGPNGSGKTTLFQILNGAFRPAKGEVLFDMKNIRAYSVLERACRIAYVPQGGRIDFPYTGFELVLMGLHPHRALSVFPGNAALSRAEEIMRETGAWRFASKSVNTLSGGELQLVFLTRSLLQMFPYSHETQSVPEEHVPKLLLLDEALSELDISRRIGMMKLLNRTLERRRFTIIGIHHDLHLAYRFANRIIALHQGSIAADGKPDEIFTREFFSGVFGVQAEIIPGKGFFFQDDEGEEERGRMI
jgi:iron complex transport system ATP-binding protein